MNVRLLARTWGYSQAQIFLLDRMHEAQTARFKAKRESAPLHRLDDNDRSAAIVESTTSPWLPRSANHYLCFLTKTCHRLSAERSENPLGPATDRRFHLEGH